MRLRQHQGTWRSFRYAGQGDLDWFWVGWVVAFDFEFVAGGCRAPSGWGEGDCYRARGAWLDGERIVDGREGFTIRLGHSHGYIQWAGARVADYH